MSGLYCYVDTSERFKCFYFPTFVENRKLPKRTKEGLSRLKIYFHYEGRHLARYQLCTSFVGGGGLKCLKIK